MSFEDLPPGGAAAPAAPPFPRACVQIYIQLYFQSVNYADEQQIILTVMIGSEMLGSHTPKV